MRRLKRSARRPLLKIGAPELGDAQSLLNDLSVLATQANAIKTALADDLLAAQAAYLPWAVTNDERRTTNDER